MKILMFGRDGQVGTALTAALAGRLGEVVALGRAERRLRRSPTTSRRAGRAASGPT